jgi:ABC-type branched-subunit amino acid transport system permease subunit
MIDQIFYTQPFSISHGQVPVPPLHFLGMEFSSKRSLLLLVTIVFAVCGIGIVMLRRSAFGRRLVALRDSEAASVTVGVNVFETKLLVFSLSAGMAGFAGAFFAMDFKILTQPPNNGFEAFTGLAIVLALVIGGVGFVAGALFAGVFGLITQIIQDNWHISLWLALIYLARPRRARHHPESVGRRRADRRGFARLLPWRRDAKQDYEELRAANADRSWGARHRATV